MMRKTPRTVKEIKAAPYNPRQISDEQLIALRHSMREFGDLGGIVVNLRTGHMVGGHQRIKNLDPKWRITKRPASDHVGTVALGWIQTDFGKFSYREVRWPLRKEKAANLAANKISGEWDEEKLVAVLEDLKDLPEIDLTGFEPGEIDELLVELAPAVTFSEPPKSVKKNLQEMQEFKEMRKSGNEKIQGKTDTEKYLVIVFENRQAKNSLLAELGLPGDERYIAAESLSIKRRHRIVLVKEKSAMISKAGATG